jgi:hypothetical protein
MGLAGSAAADPTLELRTIPLGGGLTRYHVDVDFQDGGGKSGFVQVTFNGPFDAQSQLTTANWPDIQNVQAGGSLYMLQGGTGGGSSVDVVEVGQLVVPVGESFSYNAVISRGGQNFVVVPEPGVVPLGIASTLTLGVAARSRRRRTVS